MKEIFAGTTLTQVIELRSVCFDQFCIGGVFVRVQGEGDAVVALSPALIPFRTQRTTADIDVRVELVDRLSRSRRHRAFDSGAVWQLFADENGFEFDFTAPVFGDLPYKRLSVNSSFSRATLTMSDFATSLVPITAPLDYPLDELLIMHRLTQEKAIELHGAGIVTSDGVGNLFVGHSEAGKSTTTRLWTACEDVEVLSDDRIIVRRDEGLAVETPLRAAGPAGEHGVLRLRDRSASPSAHSAQDDRASKMRMYGTPWHGEAMYASPNSAPLTRILVLEHGHGNILTPLPPSQAVAELFARSFVPFHRHEYVESALTFLQEVVEAVPVYRYSFEPDHRAVDTILNLRD